MYRPLILAIECLLLWWTPYLHIQTFLSNWSVFFLSWVAGPRLRTQKWKQRLSSSEPFWCLLLICEGLHLPTPCQLFLWSSILLPERLLVTLVLSRACLHACGKSLPPANTITSIYDAKSCSGHFFILYNFILSLINIQLLLLFSTCITNRIFPIVSQLPVTLRLLAIIHLFFIPYSSWKKNGKLTVWTLLYYWKLQCKYSNQQQQTDKTSAHSDMDKLIYSSLLFGGRKSAMIYLTNG